MGCNDTYTRTAPEWDIEEAMDKENTRKTRRNNTEKSLTSRSMNERRLRVLQMLFEKGLSDA